MKTIIITLIMGALISCGYDNGNCNEIKSNKRYETVYIKNVHNADTYVFMKEFEKYANDHGINFKVLDIDSDQENVNEIITLTFQYIVKDSEVIISVNIHYLDKSLKSLSRSVIGKVSEDIKNNYFRDLCNIMK
jgi:hypothetical protein